MFACSRVYQFFSLDWNTLQLGKARTCYAERNPASLASNSVSIQIGELVNVRTLLNINHHLYRKHPGFKCRGVCIKAEPRRYYSG